MKNNSTRGFSLIKFLLTIVIIIVFISLLGFDLQEDIVMNETVQTNFSFILNWLSNIWDNHLSAPVLHVWNDVIIQMLWDPFVDGILQGNFINEIQNPASNLQ